ncbi:tail protein X [Budviciaceae bacterium BWR-B9]|uniref:Tail protein X n=1 Tax=Limnobaculum allomyrinae TaxID=2791986 RepID=A0ABS1IMS9_9GAMM|nr:MULTISPECIES: tail protein X [Limnobaculum]MBK5142984.1 tail protein X [Limnobaculum allomyrinae]MBV7693313.1 tail protein X [Limnobaculum sp. M2-1]
MTQQYRFHITTEGERWDQLAWRYYGDAYLYPQIIAANRHVAITPTFKAGITLAIPLIESKPSSVGMPPWKS